PHPIPRLRRRGVKFALAAPFWATHRETGRAPLASPALACHAESHLVGCPGGVCGLLPPLLEPACRYPGPCRSWSTGRTARPSADAAVAFAAWPWLGSADRQPAHLHPRSRLSSRDLVLLSRPVRGEVSAGISWSAGSSVGDCVNCEPLALVFR